MPTNKAAKISTLRSVRCWEFICFGLNTLLLVFARAVSSATTIEESRTTPVHGVLPGPPEDSAKSNPGVLFNRFCKSCNYEESLTYHGPYWSYISFWKT